MSEVNLHLDLCDHLNEEVERTHEFHAKDAASTVYRPGTPPTVTARCVQCDAEDQPMVKIWLD